MKDINKLVLWRIKISDGLGSKFGVKVPQKVACFTWLLSNEAVLTLENVARQVYLYATDAPYVVRIQRQ